MFKELGIPRFLWKTLILNFWKEQIPRKLHKNKLITRCIVVKLQNIFKILKEKKEKKLKVTIDKI